MAKQEIEDKKKRARREKIEKHINQLPLWDLFQIYFYIKWFTFQEKLSRLGWTWLILQLELDEEKSRKGTSGFRLNKLILRYSGWGLFVGGALASYISLTTFWQLPYNLWLVLHNLLIVASLLLAAFAGYQHRVLRISFRLMLLSIAIFFAVMMFLYLGSYVVTTTLLTDRMVWIPFFYHDYNYHGFKSVTEYLNHENNYRELLKLQVFSFSISSVMYFAAGSVGFSIKTMMDRARRWSGIAPSGS